MKHRRIPQRILLFLCLGALLCTQLLPHALAYESTTLYNGCTGEEVRQLQQALIQLGFLNGAADGIFGNQTENAVRAFQKKNKLDVDGLAGSKTRQLIQSQVSGGGSVTPAPTATSSPVPSGDPAPTPAPTAAPTPDPSPSGSLFGGDYSTIRYGNRGSRVKAMQKGLIGTGCLKGAVDGIFGGQTLAAVRSFQQSKNLVVDGIAGKKTLTALEKAYSGGSSATDPPAPTATPANTPAPEPTATADPDDGDLNGPISAPSVSSLVLLHWFNDIKPTVSSGQTLLIYDPASGLNWTVRILSCGRHCDAEPLTARDTRTMVKAFGGTNTWNQKAVCVKLPSGTWTIGSTHDMPHDSGSIKDNKFNGHLCVHFLRDMDEAKKNDPKYGVSNQETIRTYWKKWTGQEITD